MMNMSSKQDINGKWLCVSQLDPRYATYEMRMDMPNVLHFININHIVSVSYRSYHTGDVPVIECIHCLTHPITCVTKLGKPMYVKRISDFQCRSLAELLINLELDGYVYDYPNVDELM